MPDIVTQHNIGALGDLVRLSDHSTATAGGTGNATLVTGNTIDRMGFGGSGMPGSALMGVIFESTLGATDTLSVAFNIQNSPDGSTWTDYLDQTAQVFATGPAGGGTVKGEANIQVDLGNAMRFIRCNYTPTLSAASVDVFYGDAVGFFAGFPRIPAPNT